MEEKDYTFDEIQWAANNTPVNRPPMNMEDYNLIYANHMQMSVMGRWRCRKMGIESGRGCGKSSLLSDTAYYCNQTIPGGSDALIGSSYRQILGITFPTLFKELAKKWHMIEGRDFTRGKAPAKLGFEMPYYNPSTWANTIHWRNGSVTSVISGACKFGGNGVNLTSVRCDEMKTIDYKWYQDSVKPGIRGTVRDHPGWRRGRPGVPGNPWYCSEIFVSDMGVSKLQRKWSIDIKSQETVEINEEIAQMLAEFKIAEEQGYAHALMNSPKFYNKLQELRCQSTAYFNFSTISNLAILGGGGVPEDYIKGLERSMAPLLFQICILGKELIEKTPDSYYKQFSEEIHCYSSDQTTEESILNGKFNRKFKTKNEAGTRIEWEAPDLDEISSINDTCLLDSDLDEDAPLLLGYDFNHGVNCMCIAQCYKFEGIDSLMFLKTMYNMDERRLEGLCDDFCRYYVYKKVKEAVVFIDSTAKQGGAYASQFGDDLRFYNIIKRKLELHGWKVTIVDIGAPMAHDVKYEFVNDVFSGKYNVMPRINKEKNDLLIASIQSSTICYGMDGKVRKYKGLEKKKAQDEDTRVRLAATDITDSCDSLIIGVIKTDMNFSGSFNSGWGVQGVPTLAPMIF